MTWIYTSGTRDFNPSLVFGMQELGIQLWRTAMTIWIHAVNSKKKTIKSIMKIPPFCDDYKPKREPHENECFPLADFTDKAWRRQHTSQRRRWQSSGRLSAKWVSTTGKECEVVAGFLLQR